MATPLEQAAAYIKSGNTEKGKHLLTSILRENPGDENAWLWMSRCVTTAEQQRECFERVLKINPQNLYAIEGLNRLNASPPSIPPPRPPVRPQMVAPKKKSKLNLVQIILAVLASIICVCSGILMLGILFDGTPTSSQPDTGSETSAYYICQEFIEKRLAAPATAEWPSSSDIKIFSVRNKPSSYQVRGYVDAQNYMGALIRTEYVCEVTYQGNDRWHLDYLSLDE